MPGSVITPIVFQSVTRGPQCAWPEKRGTTMRNFHATENQCPFRIGGQLRTQLESLLVAPLRLDEE